MEDPNSCFYANELKLFLKITLNALAVEKLFNWALIAMLQKVIFNMYSKLLSKTIFLVTLAHFENIHCQIQTRI